VSLWSLLAAPLIASADLRKVSAASLAILSNPEVIAVDQDPAGIQGRRISEEGPLDIWMKPLADAVKLWASSIVVKMRSLLRSISKTWCG